MNSGTHSITAAYSGDGSNPAKTSAAAKVDVQSSGGGGGCTISRNAGFDWSFVVMLLLGVGMRYRRKSIAGEALPA